MADTKHPLSQALLGALAEAGRSASAAPAELEPLLASALLRAQARWPGVSLDPAGFVRHLARRLPEDSPVLDAVEDASTDDLYLAFGCVCGDRAALAAFDRELLQEVGAFVASVDRSPAFADEVRQALREKLFAEPGKEPKIAEYTGLGALGGWVRVAALRIALNLRRGEQRAAAAGKASVEGALGPGLSPELAYFQEHYREAFADALRAAVSALSDRDRTLLRLYHVDSMSLEAMAALYRVHLSTVSRWLTVARENVAEATTRHLRDRLGVGRSEVESIAALVLGQIDVSLTRLLGGER